MDSSNIPLNRITLKIEKENAKAMINGFTKNGREIKTSIFTAHMRSKSMENDFETTPKLITLKVRQPRAIYPLSDIGVALQADKYRIENKYVAILDTVFFIDNKLELWQDLCTNGVFDIWEPEAPYNSLIDKQDQKILLLRVYEMTQTIPQDKIDNTVTYFDRLTEDYKINLRKPMIKNDEFEKIKRVILQTILKNNSQKRPPQQFNDTLLIQTPGDYANPDQTPVLKTSGYDISGLLAKKQIILYGPPGTGKTFLTKGIATELISNNSKIT